MMGFVLAAVSPAVIIPCLMSLSNRGYGVEKGKKNQTQNFDWNLVMDWTPRTCSSIGDRTQTP